TVNCTIVSDLSADADLHDGVDCLLRFDLPGYADDRHALQKNREVWPLMNLDFSVLRTAAPQMIEAVGTTIVLSILAMMIGTVGGLVVMVLRISPSRVLGLIALTYVEAIRNVPLILLVYWGYYVLPILLDLRLSAFSC